jgi:hypothetical protein
VFFSFFVADDRVLCDETQWPGSSAYGPQQKSQFSLIIAAIAPRPATVGVFGARSLEKTIPRS